MKAGGFFLGTLLLANLATLSALSLHVVRSPDKMVSVVPKAQLTFVDTFVDTRDWTPLDLVHHAAFVARLNDAGQSQLIAHVGQANAVYIPSKQWTPSALAPANVPNPWMPPQAPAVKPPAVRAMVAPATAYSACGM